MVYDVILCFRSKIWVNIRKTWFYESGFTFVKPGFTFVKPSLSTVKPSFTPVNMGLRNYWTFGLPYMFESFRANSFLHAHLQFKAVYV